MSLGPFPSCKRDKEMKEEEEWLLGFFAKNIRKISPEHSRFFFPLPHRGAVWRKWMLLQKPLTVFRTANRLKRESRIAARSAICILSLSNNRGSINPPTFLLLPLWTFYNCSSGFFWLLDNSDSQGTQPIRSVFRSDFWDETRDSNQLFWFFVWFLGMSLVQVTQFLARFWKLTKVTFAITLSIFDLQT